MFAYVKEADGTVIGLNGEIVCFSYEKFQKEICIKGHCFVCGAKPNKTFNNEHIIPNWVIRSTGIHNRKLHLPNGSLIKYSTYRIPCCAKCNLVLAKLYETPVSRIFSEGYHKLINYVRENGSEIVYKWLSLIFLKVHLRDFKNKISQDNRDEQRTVGEDYDLHELHHIHAVARSSIVGTQVNKEVFGSLIIVNMSTPNSGKIFDYCDDIDGRILMLQINDIGLIYVLDDCGATIGMLKDTLKDIPQALSGIQLREIYARYLSANSHIKSSPRFYTTLIGKTGNPEINVDLPKFEIHDHNPALFGNVLAHLLIDFKNNLQINGKTGEQALDEIRSGRISFLSE